MPTVRLCPLADVADQIPPGCWLAERLAHAPAELASETVLYIAGDLSLPQLHLNAPLAPHNTLRAALPDLGSLGQRPYPQDDDAQVFVPASPFLILIAGQLHVDGALTSDPPSDTVDTPTHLMVLGDAHVRNAVLSGQQTDIQGALRVDDLLWGDSPHNNGKPGSAHGALSVAGGLQARVALFTGNYRPRIGGVEQVEFLMDEVRGVPHRAEFSSEIMGAVFAPALHEGVHDGENGLASMLSRSRVVAAVRAGGSAACSSANIHAAQPMAHDLCEGDAITAQNILAVVHSPVIAHKEHKAAGWFGQTDFALCQRHVDEEGDRRDDSVYITVWKTWDFYLAAEREPAARGPLQKLIALLGRKAPPASPQLTLIYRRYTNGQAGDWQALVPPTAQHDEQSPAMNPAQNRVPRMEAGPHTMDTGQAWQACQQAWRGVLDYVRKATGQHHARYPLYQRLHGELTATAVEEFTSLPVFTERYNDWWDSDHNGWWEGEVWVGARQPCMHNGEPWGRALKLSWKNGAEAPGDDPDDAHSAYQLDVDEARDGPPVVVFSYTQRQSEPRTALPRGAADHMARLLRFYGQVNTSIRATDLHDHAQACGQSPSAPAGQHI
ncbi:hypothetical protein [Acidovorax radicis]|uniref:hypothetical protein n=1 Tax=Acidovorax radicis TaxID=758826 RepID=UPI001CF847B7|nr:hypothetical protein [Acidovorax radicis]UCU98009.1 hypothetical protein KI609_15875 [Acidovorax radicis]